MFFGNHNYVQGLKIENGPSKMEWYFEPNISRTNLEHIFLSIVTSINDWIVIYGGYYVGVKM